MDQNFQTSFIPKKPVVKERSKSSRPVGMFFVVSIIIFFSMVLAAGGLYLYRGNLASSIVAMEEDLVLAKNRFEPERIEQLRTLDRRLQAASEILAEHIAVSPVFEVLSENTLKSVRYTNFTYEFAEEGGGMVEIKLQGAALGYRAVALQADLFSQDKNLIDPVFSNLALDTSGKVLFDLTFGVDRTFVDYKQSLATGTSASLQNLQNQNANINTANLNNLSN